MGAFGITHWIIILIIVLLLFGAGRVSNIMGELGKGLKSFKEGMADDEEEKRRRMEERKREEQQGRLPPQSRPPEQPIDVTPEPRPHEDDRTRS
jgi:sec-independent protein translocase protein TatA